MKLFFCHNTHSHNKIFRRTINTHKNMFPDSNFFLFSDGNHIEERSNRERAFNYGEKLGHKIGCTTALFKCLNMCKNFSEKNNIIPDYIVFSHDDVFVKNKAGFMRALSGCTKDVYFREVVSPRYYRPSRKYVVIDAIIFRPSIYNKIDFKKLKIPKNPMDLPRDRRGSLSPEVFVGNVFKKFNVSCDSLKVKTIIQGNVNEFGFYHIRKPRVH